VHYGYLDLGGSEDLTLFRSTATEFDSQGSERLNEDPQMYLSAQGSIESAENLENSFKVQTKYYIHRRLFEVYLIVIQDHSHTSA
jgi:hypothetical protein